MSRNFAITITPLDDGELVEIVSNMLKEPLVHRQIVSKVTLQAIDDIYYSALAAWEYQYGIGGDHHPESLTRAGIYFDMKLNRIEGPNWVKVPPPVLRNTRELTSDVEEPKAWFTDMLKDLDVARFPFQDRNYFEENVWYREKMSPVSSLVSLILRRFSLYNYTQSDAEGKLVTSSTSCLRPHKLPILIHKYAKPVHMGLKDHFVRRCLTNGVMLLNNVMGVTQFYESLFFEYSLEEFLTTPFPASSSSGIRMGRNTKTTVGGIPVRKIVNGRKGVQAPYAFSVVNKYVEDIRYGADVDYPERCCKMAFKYEIVDSMWSFGKSRQEKYLKCREFFASHFVDFLISTMVHGYRMLVERGNTICIGLKWWYGGAYSFVRELGYGRKDIHYFSGDLKGQDYSTHSYSLGLFAAAGMAYVHPNSPDYDLYNYMMRQNTDYLQAKFVNLVGNMWRWIVGTMPSGHAVTSHGNSWILAMYWWSYVYGVHERNPRAKILVRTPTGWAVSKQYFVRFKVYGDNNIAALSENVMQYLSYKDFAQWLGALDIVLQDIQDDVPLISVPDSIGNLKVTGIVFLKRYFIETTMMGITYVLPFKRFKDMAPKIVYGNSKRKNEYDVLLALSGLAWDTMGTNFQLYTILLTLYTGTVARIKKLNMSPLEEYMKTYKDEGLEQTKRARKIAIPLDDFMRFPTRTELLQRHAFNEKEFTYRKVPRPRGCVWIDDLQGETYKNKYTAN